MVEFQFPKLTVAGSSPVFSAYVYRQSIANPPWGQVGYNGAGTMGAFIRPQGWAFEN